MASGEDFDGSQFLAVAEHLQSEFSKEAFARAAIGRCYYAVFLPAQELCAALGTIRMSGGAADHGTVMNNYFEITTNPPDQKDFRNLQRWRRSADYVPDWAAEVDIQEMARKSISIAARLLENQGTG